MSDNTDTKEWRFYLAGSYSAMQQLHATSKTIEATTDWKCTSRWLDGNHDTGKLDPVKAAREDVDDLLAADIMVLSMQFDSSLGGMWVELGVALSHGMHVVVLKPNRATPITPFLRLNGIKYVDTLGELKSYMAGLSMNSTAPPRFPERPGTPVAKPSILER